MRNQFISNKIMKPAMLISVLATMSMILAACMSAATPATTPSVTQPAATQSVSSASTVTIDVASDPTLGKFLVDSKGMTLYVFTKDGPDQSNCDAKCMANWPPLVTSGTAKVGPGVDASLIGTAALADGSKIVTYDHMPLYYFIKDTQPGQISGENVGSVWFVVSPAGKPVESPSTTTPTAAPAVTMTEPTINVATDPTLGQILVDGKGMSLYIFTKDGPDQSNCNADCLAKWPPLLTLGSPKLGPGVDASQVGSTMLADGTKIVTYDHRPLYYFINDSKSGDTSGEGVGSVWFVISPSGKEIEGPVGSVETPTSVASGAFVEPTIKVATDPSLGKILVDGKGMTLYVFTKDGPDKSNCNASCIASWPPLLTQGNPTLGAGVDDSKIGSAVLADGTKIVTYNHMPLYYFIKDAKAGDTAGQGIGSVWFVISPDGEIIGK
jgi:predicted lipoprotein with Yx(FWY)xxD motif